MVLYEQAMVSRTAPVIWEWLAISTSIIWVLAQSIALGWAGNKGKKQEIFFARIMEIRNERSTNFL